MTNSQPTFDNDRTPSKSELTADAARKLAADAESINSAYARAETQAVLKQIEQAARRAERSCSPSIPWQQRDVIEKRLCELGYTVKYHDGDQREPGYYTVSW